VHERFELSRRALLGGMAAVPLVGCGGGGASSGSPAPIANLAPTPSPTSAPTPTPSPAPPFTGPSLDALAQRGGRRFGSAIASSPAQPIGGTVQNALYTAIVRAECGVVVPESEMKWQTIRPDPFTYQFGRMDDIARWAQGNGLAVRGHTLLWHRPEWFPTWLNDYDFGASPASEAARLLTEHIRTVTARYGGLITSWDVVNEAIDTARRLPMETSLSRAMGSPEAVLDLAFQTARQQLPGAQLVYNDYMGWEPQHRDHRTAVLRLLEGFRARGTPVDALGIQSHIEMLALDAATGVGRYDEQQWRAFLDEVVAMGYRLLITEFDVKDRALPADTGERDARVADYARRYFEIMLDYQPHLDDVLAWGMVDAFSWLQGFEVAGRADGLEVRGSPYDSQYRPKPLREAIAASLTTA